MARVRSDGFRRPQKVRVVVAATRSRLATWSIRLAWLFFIPAAPLAGMMLGVLAIVRLHRRPGQTGSCKALAAIGLGFALSLVQAVLGFRAYEHDRMVTVALPEALASGDASALASLVEGTTVREAESFLRTFRQRFGDSASCAPTGIPYIPRPTATWTVRSGRRTAAVEGAIALSYELDATCLRSRIGSLTVSDSRGSLVLAGAAARRIASHP